MIVQPYMYFIILPMVFLAALIDSIGGGGGLISLPSYTMAGLPYDFASGTNKFSAMFGSLTATIKYLRSGKILLIPALMAIIGALPGAYIGTKIAMLISNKTMTIIMICLMPFVAIIMLIKRKDPVGIKKMNAARLTLCFIIGFVIGAYDGFFGPGTGTFLTMLFTWIAGMDMVTAAGTSKPVNLASNLSSLIARIIAGQVVYALAIPATLFSIAGGYIGARLAVTKGAKLIRLVLMLVVALLMVTLIIDLIAAN